MLSSFSYGPLVRQAIVRRIIVFGCALGAVLILLAARMVHPELYTDKSVSFKFLYVH